MLHRHFIVNLSKYSYDEIESYHQFIEFLFEIIYYFN